MVPYYKDEFVTIYHGDFRNIPLPEIGLLLADPPFDIWEKVVADIKALPYESMLAFTNWQNRYALETLGRPRAEIVWGFPNGRWVSHNLPRITHETILAYGKVYNAYVGRSMEGIKPIRKGKGSVGRDKMPDRTWVPRERALLNSYFIYPRDVSSGVWTKPLPLITQLLEWLCPVDKVIFDPFTGSGTTLVAAKSLGITAIGSDISEEMCERAATRCRSYIYDENDKQQARVEVR